MENFEKLGSFYLGKKYDLQEKKITDELVLYDSKDLTTHAVSLGMTGSGKTGLCISLLEEAAIDSIPAIIIDPKGDMTNLLLTFPDLLPENFRPWIDESEAARKGLSPEKFAEKQAELWKNGLAGWGEDGERIQRLKDSADYTIYTPGSSAGMPVSILKSFAAPPVEIREEMETFQERISTTVTSLLGLLGIDADPVKSREHILLSTILNHSWGDGRDLTLPDLIQSVQNPPVSQIGVFNVDSFYPAKERFDLAMRMTNLLASPAFQTWLEGDAMDVQQFLYTESGKPRVSIFYIAHLSDAERMFFVSMLLNQFIGWMRTQSGTGSLRALLYIDELYGYMPPVSNPPSKKPLLTLLKQARAFGVGVVVATQNPVDLDYKGLSNTGTWFLGRLQTERDRDRVLDGLAGVTAAGGGKFDRPAMERTLSGLDKRVFLLHNVHEDAPVVFHTRWAMSYLSGPLTRNQIKDLVQKGTPKPVQPVSKAASGQARPTLPPDIRQLFVPVRGSQPAGSDLVYQPALLGSAAVHFSDRKTSLEETAQVTQIFPLHDGALTINWEEGEAGRLDETELDTQPETDALFGKVPAAAGQSKNYSQWEKDFKDYLYRFQKRVLLKSPSLKEISLPEETEQDFRIRITQISREQRDDWTDKLREKYAKKMASVEEKMRKAQQKIEREKEQSQQQKYQTAISIGATLIGAFLGRKAVSRTTVSKAGTAIRSASRSFKEAGDIDRAEEDLQQLQQRLKDLETEFQEEVTAYSEKSDVMKEELEAVTIRPKKTNISVKLVSLVWTPFWRFENGRLENAWE